MSGPIRRRSPWPGAFCDLLQARCPEPVLISSDRSLRLLAKAIAALSGAAARNHRRPNRFVKGQLNRKTHMSRSRREIERLLSNHAARNRPIVGV
jgi:hypothetical protein